MFYSKLADIYEALEATTKKLEKAAILSELYKKYKQEELRIVVLLSIASFESELGIAREMMRRIIMKAYGASEAEVTKKFRDTGDLGLVAEYFAAHRKQARLEEKRLSVEHVFENLKKLPNIAGTGSQEKKIVLVAELLAHASPKESLYIVRTVLGDMRIGVAHGIVRDAIAKAFEKSVQEVEHTWNVVGDAGKVAELAAKGKGKLNAEIELGRPVRVMLGDRAENLKEALEEFETPALEIKYDGFRLVIHKQDSKIWLFSRRLENVTHQFPEIREWARENLRIKSCVVEGEVLAIDKEGNAKPFQTLSRRIQRKYDIEKMVREIPVQINLFDIIYLNGESYMDKPLKERWKKLKEIVKQTQRFRLAEHLETKNMKEAEKFYQHALKLGQEGVMVKNLDAYYQPGRRVGYWLKVKPIMEPLDLVIVGGEWGEGKRAKWIGSLTLACREGNKFLETGMMGSGLTEEQLEATTKKLKKLIVEEHGRTVKVKPEIVVEVAYEEIQRSPKYPTGYALRFPRLLRFREAEKTERDINTRQDIEKLFKQQKRFKRK